MHRQIMGALDGMEVDHINRDRLDNRRSNLRVVTHAKQMQNRSKNRTYRGRPTSSQYRGVSWSKREQRWKVKVGGAVIFEKLFDNEHEAAAAASAARLKWMSHTVEDPAPVVVPSQIPPGKIEPRQPGAAEPTLESTRLESLDGSKHHL